MKIFITGAAGYIGSVLVGRLLQEGWEVTALDNLMYNQTSLFQYCHHDNFDFVKADVRRIVNFPECDVFLPLASITGPACEKNPDSYAINTLHYKDVIIPRDQTIIFPMTNSGYGTTTGEVYCTEESPLQPISAYGKQKVATENYFFDNFTNVTSLRLATVFGVSPHMRFDVLVNDMVYNAEINRGIHIYEPNAMRNYVHISDVAECFIWCIKNPDKVRNQIFNLGNDEINMSKIDLAKIIQTWTMCEVFISKKGQDPDKRNYIVSNEKLRQAGFEAKYTLVDGIVELLKCIRMLPRRRFRNI